MYDPTSHAHCWTDHNDTGTSWWDNGMVCPEQDHPDHA